ncbi:MAG TPA: phosphatase domain-containing protein [Flavobacterium sp.]|jgi:phosphatidate phosphatase APP1
MRKRLQKLFNNYTIQKILIVPYRSYGTSFRIYVKGRVLDNPPLVYSEKQSLLQTIRNALGQFDTHEIGNLAIVLKIAGFEVGTTTDRKGYFLIDEVLPADISGLTDHEGWATFQLSVCDTRHISSETITGEFLVPEKEADYGIISDIDDTILDTGVTSFLKWKVLRNSLFVNAYRRIPLAGAPELYRKLHKGV